MSPWELSGNGDILAEDFLGPTNDQPLRIRCGNPESPLSLKMLIAANGNVGIGTSNPGAKLDVEGNVKANKLEVAETVNAQTVNAQTVKASKYQDLDGNPLVTSQWSGTANGPISFSGDVGIGTTGTPGAKLDVKGTVKAQTVDATEYKKNGSPLETSPSQWSGAVGGKISYSGGNVGIGTTNPQETLEVNGNVAVGTKIELHASGLAVKPGGGPWSSPSDIRLKKNVTTLKGALEKLSRLRGVSFEWEEPENHGDLRGQQMGLIAQEVEEVLPEWVDAHPSGYKILTARGFEALVVEALKELKADNETLKAHNDELRSQLGELRSQLGALQPA
jgi:hypothetical protein